MYLTLYIVGFVTFVRTVLRAHLHFGTSTSLEWEVLPLPQRVHFNGVDKPESVFSDQVVTISFNSLLYS